MDTFAIAQLGQILGVWAHPDDEAYCSGGLMLRAADAGQPAVVVTATRGEHGTPDPETFPPHRLAAIRESEMANAAAAAGVSDHRFLSYSDGGCESANWEEAIATLEAIVRDVRPDTVVTFGPDGMTGHPDHISVSAWITEAARRVSPATRVLYATTLPGSYEPFADLDRKLGIYGPEGPPVTEPSDLAVDLRLDPELLERKLRVLEAHASQTSIVMDAFGVDRYRTWIAAESFRPATATEHRAWMRLAA